MQPLLKSSVVAAKPNKSVVQGLGPREVRPADVPPHQCRNDN